MNIVLIGCVHSSWQFLQALLEMPQITVVGVVSRRQSEHNADFVDLTPLCEQQHIPLHYYSAAEPSATVRFIRQLKPDLLYCFGWSLLLPADILQLPSIAAVGFHPAKLPENRGRHPIIWALALGLKQTASSFFMLDEGADSGPLLSQQSLPILPDDNATSLYRRIMAIAVVQMQQMTIAFVNGTIRPEPQNHALANYWRKRGYQDGQIDWRMSAEAIHNLIRALAPPYPGAHFVYKSTTLVVQRSELSQQPARQNLEPGRVLATTADKILVKCQQSDAIWLCDLPGHQIQTGECL